MVAQHFGVMAETLPNMLQVAPLLFCYWLSRCPWNINRAVTAVIIATSPLGFMFDICTVSAATALCDCPYQTTIALLRLFVYCDVRRNVWYQGCARTLKSFQS